MKPVVMLADANVFLRFLRNDHAGTLASGQKVIEQAAAGEVILRCRRSSSRTFFTRSPRR
jgi:hypothetical protein